MGKISRELSVAAVQPHASDGHTLEVGAFGHSRFRRFFPDRIGVDIREGPGVDRIASVYDLPFEDGEFENVLCMSVLEHLEEPKKAITEMHRVLKPGGRIIMSVPFLFPIHEAPDDYWRFTKYGLQKLFSEGWEIIELKAEADVQDSMAILLQRLAYQGQYRLDKLTKLKMLLMARILKWMPRWWHRMFGDIYKRKQEDEAFASAFFLVATKK